MADMGKEVTVARVSGKLEVKRHLEDLGFVTGSKITVVQSHDGDMIVKVKDARLAITREMAGKIWVEEMKA